MLVCLRKSLVEPQRPHGLPLSTPLSICKCSTHQDIRQATTTPLPTASIYDSVGLQAPNKLGEANQAITNCLDRQFYRAVERRYNSFDHATAIPLRRLPAFSTYSALPGCTVFCSSSSCCLAKCCSLMIATGRGFWLLQKPLTTTRVKVNLFGGVFEAFKTAKDFGEGLSRARLLSMKLVH
eukprot:Gb_13879 [translate_table: standard]